MLAEAEKALKKYPHAFQIIAQSAALYRSFGCDCGGQRLCFAVLEVLERSRLLLKYEDPQISVQTINGRNAQTYLWLGETDKATELWNARNADGVYSPPDRSYSGPKRSH